LFTPSTHLELEEIILTRIHDVTDLEEQREGNERGMGRMRRENDEVKELVSSISSRTWCTDTYMGSQRKFKIFDSAFI
jgi:hypothetical protein